MSQKTNRRFHIFKKHLQVRENVVGFEKALGAVKVIKDQIQYRFQSLLDLARDYFRVHYCQILRVFVTMRFGNQQKTFGK